MGQRLVALVAALAVGFGFSVPAWAAADQSDGERTSRKVLAFFQGHSDETIDAFLMRLRPAPLDGESRAKVIASLPKDGEVRPSGRDGEKLSAAQRILDYSASPGAVTLKVIDLDSAFVGLYYRTVVLVSAKALALQSADELAALVAHEMGHDADWDAYLMAIQAHDSEGMRELELKADGLGVLTLEHLGISPERLASAVQKMMRYNDWQDRAAGATPQLGKAPGTGDRYVSLDDRLAFIRAVAQVRWVTQSRAATANTSCPECDVVVRRVLPLLPRQPARVTVIDLDHATRLLRVCGPDVSLAGPPTPAQPVCRECDRVVDRVLRLLPDHPDAVVVIDANRATPALRQATRDFEGFATEGERTVYLKKQGPMFRRALQGASIWDYALACTVWHEMAHIAGADEREAQRREEELLTQFIAARKVEATWGLWYLQRLRQRHPEETRTAGAQK